MRVACDVTKLPDLRHRVRPVLRCAREPPTIAGCQRVTSKLHVDFKEQEGAPSIWPLLQGQGATCDRCSRPPLSRAALAFETDVVRLRAGAFRWSLSVL